LTAQVGEVFVLYLEYARRNRKMTQRDLSQQTRIAQYHISDMELGKVWPTPDQLQRLATALELPAELVLTEVPLPQQSQVMTEVA
jgi:transcriptional regulator with XRE-family HTH domain